MDVANYNIMQVNNKKYDLFLTMWTGTKYDKKKSTGVFETTLSIRDFFKTDPALPYSKTKVDINDTRIYVVPDEWMTLHEHQGMSTKIWTKHIQAAQCSLVQNIYFGLQKIGSLCPKNRRKVGNYRPKMAFL